MKGKVRKGISEGRKLDKRNLGELSEREKIIAVIFFS